MSITQRVERVDAVVHEPALILKVRGGGGPASQPGAAATMLWVCTWGAREVQGGHSLGWHGRQMAASGRRACLPACRGGHPLLPARSYPACPSRPGAALQANVEGHEASVLRSAKRLLLKVRLGWVCGRALAAARGMHPGAALPTHVVQAVRRQLQQQPPARACLLPALPRPTPQSPWHSLGSFAAWREAHLRGLLPWNSRQA